VAKKADDCADMLWPDVLELIAAAHGSASLSPKGRGGIVYRYYFCVGRQQKRTTCLLKCRPIGVVEERLTEHYRQVGLRAHGIAETARYERSRGYTATAFFGRFETGLLGGGGGI
jgi:hypothetical protein